MAKVPPDAVGERAREGELGSDGASLSGDGSNKPAFDSRVETGEIFGNGIFIVPSHANTGRTVEKEWWCTDRDLPSHGILVVAQLSTFRSLHITTVSHLPPASSSTTDLTVILAL
ncbi:MAG: hypothetical protein Q9206_003119 [Seirophora lacunosa]